jgi:hypothetical protein
LALRQSCSAGVHACGFGRRLAARIQPNDAASQRDAAETRSRGRLRYKNSVKMRPAIASHNSGFDTRAKMKKISHGETI